MSRYEEYKDSCTAWMGKIPSHWKLERAKWHFTSRNERGNDTPVLLAATQKYGMYPQDMVEGVVKVAEGTDVQQFRTVHKGDFVISLRSFQGGFERSDYEGVCSPAYQVFYADDSWNNDYLKYLFKNELFIDAMNALTVGIREGRNIKYEDFANSVLAIPPLAEQADIAEYLDRETEHIDAIIAEATASIEEYKAWKASIIYEAVTKGLNPNVEMKDSGIEWIGKIASTFDVQKLKLVADIFGRIGFRGYTAADLVAKGEGAIALSPSNLEDGRMQFEKCSYVSWEKYYESPEIIIKSGDVLMVKTGASYGKTAYVDEIPSKATINPQLVVFKNFKINNKYFCYFMQTSVVQNQIEGIVTGGTIPTMSQNKLGNLYIFLPGEDEQYKIVAYLDEKCSSINSVIADKEALIADLEAYKKSLIFEVITGKRKVV